MSLDTRVPAKVHRQTLTAAAITLWLAGAAGLDAQQARAPGLARAAAPLDPSGVWVSVVTEDWKWRMPTPAKGDTLGIPLNEAGRRTAGSWDYAKDNDAGNECKAYGAGGIMRMPTRLRISWVDDQTLKIETDAGRQTRLLHFDRSRQLAGPRALQGHSVAEWVDVFRGRGAGPPPAVRHWRHARRHDASERRVLAEEWRAVQPECHRDRVLRPGGRPRRDTVDDREDLCLANIASGKSFDAGAVAGDSMLMVTSPGRSPQSVSPRRRAETCCSRSLPCATSWASRSFESALSPI